MNKIQLVGLPMIVLALALSNEGSASARVIASRGSSAAFDATTTSLDGSDAPAQVMCYTTEPDATITLRVKNLSTEQITVIHVEIRDAATLRAMSAYTGSVAPGATITYVISEKKTGFIANIDCSVVYAESQNGSWSISTTDSSAGVPEVDAPQVSEIQPAALLRASPTTSLEKVCPAISTISKLAARAADARAVMAYGEERDMKRKIALIYFHCAAATAGGNSIQRMYVHDKSLLLYAETIDGVLGNEVNPQAFSQLSQVVRDLVAGSQFREIRNAALTLAAQLPTPPSVPPPAVALDARACRASGFEKDINDWLDAYNAYADDTQSTNLMGRQKATLLSDVGYGASVAVEGSAVQKLSSIESDLLQDMQKIEQANAPETAKAVEEVLDAVNQTNSYAKAFTDEAHRGLNGLEDVNHIKASRLSVDGALMKLQQIPYCER